MKRISVIAGNWKMHKTGKEARAYIEQLRQLISKTDHRVLIAAPFTAIQDASDEAKGSKVEIGAQNMHEAVEGAFTGEISARMLQSAGASFVILGHSERRTLFSETNAVINQKLKSALKSGLTAILCIGETWEEREANQTSQILSTQLQASLDGIEDFKSIIIAYEPVWAIGTGKTATAEIAQQTHLECRTFIERTWGPAVAAKMAILYGGSVKPETISTLMAQSDIDGVLVGGASLDAEGFSLIVNF